MCNYSKVKKFELSERCLLSNPQSIIDFMYGFHKNFSYEIIGVDTSSEDRTFVFQYLYYKNGVQRNVDIEFSSFEEKLKYTIYSNGINKLSFEEIYKNEINYINKFI